jgi:polar amino acid transport system substrate-binding protein
MAKTVTGFIVFVFLMTGFVPLVCSDDLLLAADPWCPYNCGETDPYPGFMVEIARAVFEKHGIRITYVTVPWSRAVHGTRTGQYDGVIGAGRNETPDFVFPDIEQGLACHTFYVRKGNPWRYDGPASLDQVTLGVIRNYSYGPLFDTYIRQYQNDPARVQVISGESGLTLNVRKLAANRIDVLIEDRTVFEYFLYNSGVADEFDPAGVAVRGYADPGNDRTEKIRGAFRYIENLWP